MVCSCIKNQYDAYISNKGSDVIVYEDMSLWMREEGYEIPSEYSVKITTPSGFSETLDLKVGCRNLITTAHLFGGQQEGCFEDGFYCFETESCGVSYKISRAYLPNTQCTIDYLAATAKTDADFDRLFRFNSLMESVKINASEGNEIVAEEILDLLMKQLDRFSCE
jgi:hypothetical protein